MGGKCEVHIFFQAVQAAAEVFPIAFAGFDEGRQAAELDAADGGLDVKRLQVIAEMRVDVFVVVAFGQFAELPLEAFVTSVVLAGSTPAVASPVAKAFGISLERGFADDIDGSALTHGEVVGRIE